MMKKRFSDSGVLMATSIVIAYASLSNAAVMIKQDVHTDSFEVMGQKQPAQNETNVIWLGEGAARMDQADTNSWIVYPDRNLVIELNHNSKTYSEIPVGEGSGMTGMADEEHGKSSDAEKVSQMMKALMKMEVKVTPTDETKKIRDWNCRKYIVETKMGMGTSSSETWTTEDIKADYDLFYAISKAFMSSIPGYKDIVDEMKKLEGLAVYTEGTANVMGTQVKTVTEVVDYKDGPAPEGIFDIPAEYTKAQR